MSNKFSVIKRITSRDILADDRNGEEEEPPERLNSDHQPQQQNDQQQHEHPHEQQQHARNNNKKKHHRFAYENRRRSSSDSNIHIVAERAGATSGGGGGYIGRRRRGSYGTNILDSIGLRKRVGGGGGGGAKLNNPRHHHPTSYSESAKRQPSDSSEYSGVGGGVGGVVEPSPSSTSGSKDYNYNHHHHHPTAGGGGGVPKRNLGSAGSSSGSSGAPGAPSGMGGAIRFLGLLKRVAKSNIKKKRSFSNDNDNDDEIATSEPSRPQSSSAQSSGGSMQQSTSSPPSEGGGERGKEHNNRSIMPPKKQINFTITPPSSTNTVAAATMPPAPPPITPPPIAPLPLTLKSSYVERHLSRRTRSHNAISRQEGKFPFQMSLTKHGSVRNVHLEHIRYRAYGTAVVDAAATTYNAANGNAAAAAAAAAAHGHVGGHHGMIHPLSNSFQDHEWGDNGETSLSSIVLKTLSNKKMCDVEMVGKDDIPVEVPSYLLAAHSEVFEEMFYSGSLEEEDDDDEKKKKKNACLVKKVSSSSTEGKKIKGNEDKEEGNDEPSSCLYTLKLPFAAWDAIEASVNFLAAHSLPEGLKDDVYEFNLRSICQVYLFGRLFKISTLVNQAYRTARLFMNKKPHLVCAAFDECLATTGVVEGMEFDLPTSLDEIKAYALDYMRESPLTTLLEGGTSFLNAHSIEAIICDQDMDADEFTMFTILSAWVKANSAHVATGKKLVSNINLAYIRTDHLNGAVKHCGFVDPKDVAAALKEIDDMKANQSPREKEHVVVEGAGIDDVNGIYVRMEEDIGLDGGEEVMFIKEPCGTEDEEGEEEEEHFTEYGLYLMRSTWAITPCVDYSNILYACELPSSEGREGCARRNEAPKRGWTTAGGTHPPPTCTWNPSKNTTSNHGNHRDDSKSYVAPNLADLGTNRTKVSDPSNGDHDEGVARRRLTLRTMLNLPTDEGHQEDDYHDDIEDSYSSRDIYKHLE